jgi:MFS family permease
MIQGLAFGAEWGGAVMMAYEHAPWRRRGFFAAIPQAGNPLGIALANVTFLASVALPGDFAWRVPFLASVVLVVVGLVVRAKLSESPEFRETQAAGKIAKNPLTKVVRDDWRNILRIIALRVVESCAYYITATYVLNYATKDTGLVTRNVALTGLVLASVLAIGMTLLAGRVTDAVGRRPVYLSACIAVVVFAFPLFLLVNTGNNVLVVLAFVIGIGLIHATLTGTQAAWFAELFRTNTRTSGASLGYQVAAAIAGFAPFLAALLATRYDWQGPATFYLGVGVIGVLGVLATGETWSRARRREVDAFIRGEETRDDVEYARV